LLTNCKSSVLAFMILFIFFGHVGAFQSLDQLNSQRGSILNLPSPSPFETDFSLVDTKTPRFLAVSRTTYSTPSSRDRTKYTRRFAQSSISSTSSVEEKPCFYKPKGKGTSWLERTQLRNLKVGQELSGYVVQQLLNGKTGPKLFCECGVGATDSKGEWRIVYGMLRLGRSKLSVANKRAMRLKRNDKMSLYVSRIQLECGRFEVCLEPEDVERYRQAEPKVPVTSLKLDATVKGRVVQIRPYGVMVDVGANRLGLLHIQKVADLYDQYIKKEEGLITAGLEMGAKIRLKVSSIEKRRLFLDFTDDVYEDAEKERSQLGKKVSSTSNDVPAAETRIVEEPTISAVTPSVAVESIAAWAEYASQGQVVDDEEADDDEGDEEEEDDDEDDYDEDRDIEDSLGLGMY
jgi:predicted RNA-binding protein with RPS1 domain